MQPEPTAAEYERAIIAGLKNPFGRNSREVAVPAPVPCSNCEGSGQVSFYGQSLPCPYCDPAGAREAAEDLYCPTTEEES